MAVSGLSEYLTLDLEGISPAKGDLRERLPSDHKLIHEHISKPPDLEKLYEWTEELSQKEVGLIERKCRKNMLKEGFEITGRRNPSMQEVYDFIASTLLYRLKILAGKLRFNFNKLIR